LDEIVRVTARQEVGRRLEANEPVITADEPVIGVGVSSLRQGDEIAILNLKLTLGVR
jgi:hypothetical protein